MGWCRPKWARTVRATLTERKENGGCWTIASATPNTLRFAAGVLANQQVSCAIYVTDVQAYARAGSSSVMP